MKTLKNNTAGFSHIIMMLFVVVFAICGVGYMVATRADTSYSSSNEWSKFAYISGTGVKTAPTHSQTGKLLLQFNSKVTTYHASDTAYYKLDLPASTTASSITFDASYLNGGYNTVFLAAGSPTNIVWKVDTAANASHQKVTVKLTNKPTSIYFGIKATGKAGGYDGTFPANRTLQINSYTLYGTTTSKTPTVTLSANPTSVSTNGTSTLTWSSTNATACTASGAWSGAKATSGSTNTGALSASSTYSLSCSGSGGTASASTTVSVAAAPSGGTNAGSGNNSNLLFEGTFDSTLSKYPVKYYNAHSLTVLNSRQLRFDVSSADSLSGNEGNYRADLSTANSLIPSGTPTCTTIPIQFPNGLATVPHNSWFMFAQQKPGNVDYQGWNMGVSSWYNNNQNTWTIGTQGLGSAPAWASTKPIDTGIHTFSICSNNASDNTGAIYSIWMDGVRQTFNQGASAGKTSISGFPINKSASSYPIDINLYTGGSPVPSSLIHGAVLVNKISSPDATPPMPPGGWNSF